MSTLADIISPPLTSDSVLQLLAERGIDHEVVSHPPLMTVADAKRLRGDIDAVHVKNLFLRDKKRNFLLVTAREDAPIDLKQLRFEVGARGGLGFASEDRLGEMLGIKPGAVSPLGLLNDRDEAVKFFLDAEVANQPTIAVHPLVNDLTVVLATADLCSLLDAEGHPPSLLSFRP